MLGYLSTQIFLMFNCSAVNLTKNSKPVKVANNWHLWVNWFLCSVVVLADIPCFPGFWRKSKHKCDQTRDI